MDATLCFLWTFLFLSEVIPGAGVTVNKSRIVWGFAPPHSFLSCLDPDGTYLQPRRSVQARADGRFHLVTFRHCDKIILKTSRAAPQKRQLRGSGLILQVDLRLWDNIQKPTSRNILPHEKFQTILANDNRVWAGKIGFVMAVAFILVLVYRRLVCSTDNEFSSTDKPTDVTSRALDTGCEDTMSKVQSSASDAESSEAGSAAGLSATTFVVQPCTHNHNAGKYNLRRKCAECAKTQLVRAKKTASPPVSQSAGALATFMLENDRQSPWQSHTEVA